VRVRLVVGVGLLLVAGALVLDMSGAAPRTAGSNHASTVVFAATVPGGGQLCETAPRLPPDAAKAQILIGTYGHPVPDLRLRFLDASGTEVATGHLPAGAAEGPVTIPLTRAKLAASATDVCLRVAGRSDVVLGGEGGPIGRDSELVNGKPQGGRIGMVYLRPGKESWWQLLSVLDHRFGLGKASFFGDWTLVVIALMMLGLWAVTVRLLVRELR
jgi:hypothetical protein